MMQERGLDSDSRHIYQRTDVSGERNSIQVICDKVQPECLVLDLGSGSGLLGQYLHTQKHCIVDGIDQYPEQAGDSAHYRNLLRADLETVELATLVSDEYDVIVCADLIEHLKQPEKLLGQLNELLKPDGRLVLSIPNVAHIALVSDLIEGIFEYRQEGLLDATHLRFYTRASLSRMLSTCGIAINDIDTIELDPRETEFEYCPDSFSPGLYDLLASRADSLTYQFIVDAEFDQNRAEQYQETKPSAGESPVHLSFLTQLYWRSGTDDYSDARSESAIGKIGEEKQHIVFSLPKMPNGCAALRLDITDRPGYVRIESIRLLSPIDTLLWQWEGDAQSLFAFGHRQGVGVADNTSAEHGVVVLANSAEGFFELPIPASVLNDFTDGGTLEVVQSFPMSADYMALSPRLTEIYDRQTQQIDHLTKRIETLNSQLALSDAKRKSQDSNPGQREELIINQQHEIEELKHLTELQIQQILEREQLIEERDHWLLEKQDRAERQYQKMQHMEDLMKKHHIDITQRTSQVESREQTIGQELQTRDDSITDLHREIESLQERLQYQMSMTFWLSRPLIFVRDRFFNKIP